MNPTESLIPKLDSEPKARPGNLGRARGRIPNIRLGPRPSVAVIEANLQLVRITSRRGLTEAEREELDIMEDMLVYLAVEAKERARDSTCIPA